MQASAAAPARPARPAKAPLSAPTPASALAAIATRMDVRRLTGPAQQALADALLAAGAIDIHQHALLQPVAGIDPSLRRDLLQAWRDCLAAQEGYRVSPASAAQAAALVAVLEELAAARSS